METDIRAPPEEVGILINLAADAGSGNCDTYIIHEFLFLIWTIFNGCFICIISGIEAKCLSINPVFNEYLVVGASDPYLRMYDRRKLKYNVIKVMIPPP